MIDYFFKKELDIPQYLLKEINAFFKLKKLARNEFFIEEGQYCKQLCLIEKGYLRFFTHSDKKMITHWIFGKEQLVTDVASFFLHEPAKWSIQALTETTITSS